MSISRHGFTGKIEEILRRHFPDSYVGVFEKSELIQYLNYKTRAANKGSKARASFANLYAIYVLVEDYINGEFIDKYPYEDYKGAKFTTLFRRQRELPFGNKLQNHALNHRLNQEFRKCFPTCEYVPIIRDISTNRYWFNENLLLITSNDANSNIALAVKEVIDDYILARKSAFVAFIEYCEKMKDMKGNESIEVIEFVEGLMKPNVDARIYEIVSFAILKEYYVDHTVYWGWSRTDLIEESLVLYKTGRTNANDGGIDFVMKPLGRFFQVTETVDAGKYFLDIDKVQRYPITFVVKTTDDIKVIKYKIQRQAKLRYHVNDIVKRYMDCIEEIINIPILLSRFKVVLEDDKLSNVVDEIVLQSRIEFNEITTSTE